ncbi:tRNA (adenine(58)-N(1))-methyltransferase non-catalytic subunit TRM6 [Plasmodium brasilianum]|uniref:tRNA (Adenine(58)-N(1))-methyltransferase non-catalytic subunit TRM6 n=1 Tax=Plasmodium brasilianum TaxID=5824 RepID=A0ACB9YB40_PLABR|nr:tRNA (adenine(58)-N(1))-methyltransferase non-catalytic subunit TRM6 [Plasmodium brasilianum]
MIIRKHDFVLIDDELKCRLHKIVDMKIKIKKNYINLLFLVNKKYGSTYTFMNNKWVRSKKKKSKLDIDCSEDIKGTNKDIFYNNNSQKLTEENIAELKEENFENPYEVVQKLVDNSTTFKEKTIISKFKYVEKKLKRHFCQFTVYECNIVNLVNFYYKYFPEKISYVRIDYLANLLFHLNRDYYVRSDTHLNDEKIKAVWSIQHKLDEEKNKSSLTNYRSDNIDDDLFFKHNILIYDDSFGLLTSVINIIYKFNVNIFSLIHKNSSNAIIPSFGIRKNTNIVKVSISETAVGVNSRAHAYFNEHFDFVHSYEGEKHNVVTGRKMGKHQPNIRKNEKDEFITTNYFVNEEKAVNSYTSKNVRSTNKGSVMEQHNCKDGFGGIGNDTVGSWNNSEKEENEQYEKADQNDEKGKKGQYGETNSNDETNQNEEVLQNEVLQNEVLQNDDILSVSEEKGTKRKLDELYDKRNNEKTIPEYKKSKGNDSGVHITNVPAPNAEMEMSLLHDINLRKAESFVIILSSEFMYKTNTDVNMLIDRLINVSLKYLNNDGKIIIHTDDLNILNIFLKLLIKTKAFINIKLNEYILREQQVVKRRTHPVIKNSKLADGFLLTALKVQG